MVKGIGLKTVEKNRDRIVVAAARRRPQPASRPRCRPARSPTAGQALTRCGCRGRKPEESGCDPGQGCASPGRERIRGRATSFRRSRWPQPRPRHRAPLHWGMAPSDVHERQPLLGSSPPTNTAANAGATSWAGRARSTRRPRSGDWDWRLSIAEIERDSAVLVVPRHRSRTGAAVGQRPAPALRRWRGPRAAAAARQAALRRRSASSRAN